MKNLIAELTTSSFVSVKDRGENSTAAEITLHIPITIQKETFENYRRDARAVLNEQSKELNPFGIGCLLAALLVEVYGNNNYGSSNPS